MTTYKKVTLQQDLVAIQLRVNAARKKGDYPAQQAEFDREILATIDEGMELAKANTARHAIDVEAIRGRCKSKIDSVEETLKKKDKDITEQDYTVIKLNLPLVQKYVDELHALRIEFADAMAAGFRGGWPDIAKTSLSDVKLYAVDGKRKVMIDLDNKVSTLTARCDEYVPRAKEYLKQAIQREKAGAVEIGEFKEDMANHLVSMTAHRDAIAETVYKMRTHVSAFEGLAKKKEKEYTADDLKAFSSRIAVLERGAKEARGRRKTMTIEHEGLEKRAKGAGPGWKEPALRAVKDFEKIYKDATKQCDELTASEEMAKKVIAKVEKAVG